MSLLDRIDALCKDRGLSRRKLSMLCGFSPSTITKWSDSEPSHAKLARVAAVLEVPVEFLVGVQTEEQPTPYYLNDKTREVANAVYANSDLMLLFDNSRKMDAEDLKALIAMQEALLRKERHDD